MENLVSLFAEHHARVTQHLARYKRHQGISGVREASGFKV